MENIIEVKDVKKVFGSEKTVSTKVLDGVNMNVKEGEFVCIIGELEVVKVLLYKHY